MTAKADISLSEATVVAGIEAKPASKPNDVHSPNAVSSREGMLESRNRPRGAMANIDTIIARNGVSASIVTFDNRGQLRSNNLWYWRRHVADESRWRY